MPQLDDLLLVFTLLRVYFNRYDQLLFYCFYYALSQSQRAAVTPCHQQVQGSTRPHTLCPRLGCIRQGSWGKTSANLPQQQQQQPRMTGQGESDSSSSSVLQHRPGHVCDTSKHTYKQYQFTLTSLSPQCVVDVTSPPTARVRVFQPPSKVLTAH